LRREAALARVALVALAACARGKDVDEQKSAPARPLQGGIVQLSEQERRALDLEVTPAVEADLPEASLRFGRVRARLGEEALVVSPVAGRIPRPAQVELGTQVQAGQPLLEVVPVLAAGERVSLGVQGAEVRGQIEATARELARLETEARRSSELAQSNIVSAAKLQEVETAVATTRAKLEALRQARGVQSRGEGGAIALRAPMAGTVVMLNAPVGAVVVSAEVLARIIRPGPRWVDVAVPPEEPQGERYEVASAQTWMPARLVARGAVVEADGTRHDRIEVEGPAAAALVPGAAIPVRVARGPLRGVVLPESALVPGLGAEIVYVELKAGTFAPRLVEVAARFDGRARLKSGLKAGEGVVTRGAMALRGEAFRSQLGGEGD
jgi:cobalt-zinc-cadmium efflux system membrane fusion protein